MKEFRSSFRLIRCYFGSVREAFMLKEDRYQHWVILAAQTGRFSYVIGDDEASGEVGFGELVLCPPGRLLHRTMLEPTSFHFIEFGHEEDWFAGTHKPTDIGRLASTYRYLQQWQSGDSRSVLEHLVEDLLFLMSRERRDIEQADSLMREAAAYLETHACGHVLSLQALSRNIGLSPSQLTRRFQAAYGKTPMDYATGVRLQKASMMLRESTATLEEIAEQCGYQNGFYFSRMFSKKLGTSPSAYRDLYRV